MAAYDKIELLRALQDFTLLRHRFEAKELDEVQFYINRLSKSLKNATIPPDQDIIICDNNGFIYNNNGSYPGPVSVAVGGEKAALLGSEVKSVKSQQGNGTSSSSGRMHCYQSGNRDQSVGGSNQRPAARPSSFQQPKANQKRPCIDQAADDERARTSLKQAIAARSDTFNVLAQPLPSSAPSTTSNQRQSETKLGFSSSSSSIQRYIEKAPSSSSKKRHAAAAVTESVGILPRPSPRLAVKPSTAAAPILKNKLQFASSSDDSSSSSLDVAPSRSRPPARNISSSSGNRTSTSSRSATKKKYLETRRDELGVLRNYIVTYINGQRVSEVPEKNAITSSSSPSASDDDSEGPRTSVRGGSGGKAKRSIDRQNADHSVIAITSSDDEEEAITPRRPSPVKTKPANKHSSSSSVVVLSGRRSSSIYPPATNTSRPSHSNPSPRSSRHNKASSSMPRRPTKRPQRFAEIVYDSEGNEKTKYIVTYARDGTELSRELLHDDVDRSSNAKKRTRTVGSLKEYPVSPVKRRIRRRVDSSSSEEESDSAPIIVKVGQKLSSSPFRKRVRKVASSDEDSDDAMIKRVNPHTRKIIGELSGSGETSSSVYLTSSDEDFA